MRYCGNDSVEKPHGERRRIARELKVLRENAGLTQTEAAKRLDMSKGNLSKIENRESAPKPTLVRAALALYGVTGDEAEALIEIARGAQKRGWWQSYKDVLPNWFGFYLGLEEEASELSTYEPEIVPGLFQTERYARGMFMLTSAGDDLDRKVSSRIRRQAILHRDNPVQVSAVLNEAVLLRQVGSTEIMKEQLLHLAKLSQLPNVTIQVLPFGKGGHPAMTGPYVMLGFPDAAEEPIIYIDTFTLGHVLEEPEHFNWYKTTHEKLCSMALSPAESLEAIQVQARILE